jgi:thyroxine 5-deiodinase
MKLAASYHHLNYPIDFIIIYIREAHASDGWKFDGNNYSFIRHHRDTRDRLNAVKVMTEMANISQDQRVSIYCDTMDNITNNLFRAWPERLYVLHDQKILYRGGEGPDGYSIPSVDLVLKKHVAVSD